jgi:hypothetical protein
MRCHVQKLKSVNDVVLILGGNTVLGEELDIDPTNVANWKRQKQIPANQYRVIQGLLKGLNREADIELFSFHRMPRQK